MKSTYFLIPLLVSVCGVVMAGPAIRRPIVVGLPKGGGK